MEVLHLNIGVDYLKRKRYAEAEKSLKKALDINESNGLIHYFLGICYYRNRKDEVALRMFSEAIRKGLKVEDSNLKKGLIFFKRNTFDEAENCFNRAIEVNDRNWYLHYLLGQIKLKTNQFDEASQHFTKAIELPHGDDHSDSLLESQKCFIYSLIKQNRKEEAFSFFNDCLSSSLDKPEVVQLQARLNKELGDASHALLLIDRALEMKPLNNLIMLGDRVAYCYYCHNYADCVKEGEELLKHLKPVNEPFKEGDMLRQLKPNDKYASLRFFIGSSYLKMNNTDKGKKYIEEYEAVTSPSSRLIEYYVEKAALVLALSGNQTECLELIKKALELNGKYLPARHMKNELMLLSNNPDYEAYLAEHEVLMEDLCKEVKEPEVIPEVNLIVKL